MPKTDGEEQGGFSSARASWGHADSIEGSSSSEANKLSGTRGLVWTEALMPTDPEHLAGKTSRTKLAFAGLKDERDRWGEIAYLTSFPE